MKHLRILGLALVVVCACSAAAAATASASSFAPEFAKCVKAEKVGKKYTGKFGNKSCTEGATEGKYELASAVGTEFTGKSKTTTLHAEGVAGKAEVIVCKKDSVKGTVVSSNRLKGAVTFEDCANEKKEKCGSEGKIESSGGYSMFLEHLNEAETEDAAFSEAPMTAFSCGSERFRTRRGSRGHDHRERQGCNGQLRCQRWRRTGSAELLLRRGRESRGVALHRTRR